MQTIRKIKKILCILTLFSLSACVSYPDERDILSENVSANFLVEPWQLKLYQIGKGLPSKFRVLHIGDSHTAADMFTGEIRKILQNKYGNGGIGFVTPVSVAGQRNAEVIFDDQGWQVVKNQSYQRSNAKKSQKLPFGGIVALGNSGDVSKIIARDDIYERQNIKVHLKSSKRNSGVVIIDGRGDSFNVNANPYWENVSFQGYLPIHMSAYGNVDLGQVLFENNQKGVVYSSMGVNGAMLSSLENWSQYSLAALKLYSPDLIVLSFGSNEAFNPDMNYKKVYDHWDLQIKRLKTILPDTAIMLVGAPDLQRYQGEPCLRTDPNLYAMIRMQKQLAQKYSLKFWSWQKAMGGTCSMQYYQKYSLASSDGVHLKMKGYKKTARKFARFIIDMVNLVD